MSAYRTFRINIANGLLATCLLGISTTSFANPNAEPGCLPSGTWAATANTDVQRKTPSTIIAEAKDSRFVLLGEAHDNADHHLWQVQAIAMLLGAHDQLVIGMEMFPRRVQPALDAWIAGELTESQLLSQTDWNRVWQFDPEPYLWILRFARLNQIPVVALNVERSLVSAVGARGWDNTPPSQREGITDPAPASDSYRDILESSFAEHGNGDTDHGDDSGFEYFLQAQLTWDRAFAQGLADAATNYPSALVVGIIGSGHLRYGHGVSHQLRSMGQDRTQVWLPVDSSFTCEQLSRVADAVFSVPTTLTENRPRLGVYLVDDTLGAGVRDLVSGSVAEIAGVRSGDKIIHAAGMRIRNSADLIAIVRRQSPGTWLPITIMRDGKKIDLVAKFAAASSDEDPGGTHREAKP